MIVFRELFLSLSIQNYFFKKGEQIMMSNKRELKKTINYICSDMFAECVAASLYSGKPEKENVDALLTSILTIHSNYIQRISHPEPGVPAKKYYRDLIDNFNKEVNEVIDHIANLI